MQSDNFSGKKWPFLPLLVTLTVVAAGAGFGAGKMLGRAKVKGTPKAPDSAMTQGAAPGGTELRPGSRLQTPPTESTGELAAGKKLKLGGTPKWSTVRYGKSVKGATLVAEVAGTGPDTTLIFGAFHGNEPDTPGLVRATAKFLKQHPELLHGRRVVFAPVVNPDGLSRGKRVNANGVDLNRNFSYGWKKDSKTARYNPGPSPASEPETQAVLNLMRTYRPGKVISVHQPFRTLNYTGAKGKDMAVLMSKINGFPITGDIGYPTPGSFGDYCDKKLGLGVVTLELPPTVSASVKQKNVEAMVAVIAKL